MAVENHPAKIAKYLLKGWCLLNEYCPNGHNIPLVRSKQGVLLCVGCDPGCPYNGTYTEEGQESPEGRSVDPAATLAPSVNSLVTHDTRGSAYTTTGTAPRATAEDTCPRGGQLDGAPALEEGLFEVALGGPEFRFSCVRLAPRPGQRPRLLGDSYVVKVRFALNANAEDLVDSSALKEAVRRECEQLNDRILIPEDCKSMENKSQIGRGQVEMRCCDDGRSFSFPEQDCLVLRMARAASEELAAMVWERLAVARVTESLRRAGAHWMEVRLTESSGDEAAFRRSLLPTSQAAAAATHW